MTKHSSVRLLALGVAFIAAVAALGYAQAPPQFPLADGPWTFDTFLHRIRVVVVTKEVVKPWGLAFLPDGSMLVTEHPGRLRIIRNGVLDPKPISGVPEVYYKKVAIGPGLMDVALHPRFAENKLVYLSYAKPGERGSTTAVARGRFDGTALTEVREIFVAEAWSSKSDIVYGSRLAFGRDGMLYVTVGDRMESTQVKDGKRAQDLSDHAGKVLRLREDGSVPNDNPFIGQANVKPEIYSYGHRSPQGLAIDPQTGAIWENEHGPLGGDELNVILPGRNYGWPVVSYGREYSGEFVPTSKPGMEEPLVFWVPSIAVSGLAFYTGDRFPQWKGNVFVGGMVTGRIRGTGHIERLVFNAKGLPAQRESMLVELKQRIRDVVQSPDGLLYVLTDEDPGAILRIEPAP